MKAVITPAALLLVGCSAGVEDHAVPAAAHIERLEAKLASHPCVVELNKWERNYRFSRKTGLFTHYSLAPDLDVIEFHLRLVGTVSIEPARRILKVHPSGDWPDSSPIQSVDGKYTLGAGKLTVTRCGPPQDRSSA